MDSTVAAIAAVVVIAWMFRKPFGEAIKRGGWRMKLKGFGVESVIESIPVATKTQEDMDRLKKMITGQAHFTMPLPQMKATGHVKHPEDP